VYFHDAQRIYKIGADGTPTVFAHSAAPITAQACGPDGRLYAATADGKILALGAGGKAAAVAVGVHAHGLFVSSDGRLYAAEPGAHDELPSRLWLITPGGAKTLADTGLRHATGIVMTPDHALLFAAEGDTHWIDSYVVRPDGLLQDKQRFSWLHSAEGGDGTGDGSGATAMAEDAQGNLYVATRMGVQICDRNGRVEGILTLPDGPVTSLAFGGKAFDTLYVVCGGRLYARRLAVHGVPGCAAPISLPPFNGA
jgi:sugar lactone lactonase YvrE